MEWDSEIARRIGAAADCTSPIKGAPAYHERIGRLALNELERIFAARGALVSNRIATGTETATMAGLMTLRELLSARADQRGEPERDGGG